MNLFSILCRSANSSFSFLSVIGDLAVKNIVFGENWVDIKVTGMKVTFFAIFDPIWTHIFDPKGPSKEFLKQNFS